MREALYLEVFARRTYVVVPNLIIWLDDGCLTPSSGIQVAGCMHKHLITSGSISCPNYSVSRQSEGAWCQKKS